MEICRVFFKVSLFVSSATKIIRNKNEMNLSMEDFLSFQTIVCPEMVVYCKRTLMFSTYKKTIVSGSSMKIALTFSSKWTKWDSNKLVGHVLLTIFT